VLLLQSSVLTTSYVVTIIMMSSLGPKANEITVEWRHCQYYAETNISQPQTICCISSKNYKSPQNCRKTEKHKTRLTVCSL